MGPHTSDKMHPVSYTNSSQEGGQRKQSSTKSEFASVQGAYKPVSVSQRLPYEPESRRRPHSLDRPLPHGLLPFSSAPYRGKHSVMTLSSQPSNSSRDVWPSPPLASGDVDLNYCLQDSPIGWDGLKSDYTYTPASPNTWFSPAGPDGYPIAARYYSDKASICQPLSHACTPTSSGDLSLDGADGCFPPFQGDKGSVPGYVWGMDFMSPMGRIEASPIPWSESAADSPLSVGTPNDVLPPAQCVEARSVPPTLYKSATTSLSASPPCEPNEDLSDPADGEKADEPYAKLIYKAFMSRSDYCMTLKEIYQWFRENTKKAETGGWQNSIRHNLSMNAAFRKKEKAQYKVSKETDSSEDFKRVNEWVLEDWAICNGVQSTTRYRKSNYGRRAASGRAATAAANPWAPEHSAKRALSGRKGGCATRASRQRKRNYGHVVSLEATSHQVADGRRESPFLPAPTDLYGYDYSGSNFDAMQYFTLRQAYQEGLTGRCVNETASSNSRILELSASNFPQEVSMSNSSNLHHCQHTIGTYNEMMPIDVKLGQEPGKSPCVNYREPVVCTSPLTSSSMSRPLDNPGSGAWWHDGQYL